MKTMKLFSRTRFMGALLASGIVLSSVQFASAGIGGGFKIKTPNATTAVRMPVPRTPPTPFTPPTPPRPKLVPSTSQHYEKKGQSAGYEASKQGTRVYGKTSVVSGSVQVDHRNRSAKATGSAVVGVRHSTDVSRKGIYHSESFRHGPIPMGSSGFSVSKKGFTGRVTDPQNHGSGSVNNLRVRGKLGGFRF